MGRFGGGGGGGGGRLACLSCRTRGTKRVLAYFACTVEQDCKVGI